MKKSGKKLQYFSHNVTHNGNYIEWYHSKNRQVILHMKYHASSRDKNFYVEENLCVKQHTQIIKSDVTLHVITSRSWKKNFSIRRYWLGAFHLPQFSRTSWWHSLGSIHSQDPGKRPFWFRRHRLDQFGSLSLCEGGYSLRQFLSKLG